MNKEIFDKCCITILSFTFIVGLLILAVIYDGTFIWVFVFIGGSLVGIPVGSVLHKYPFVKGVNEDKQKKSK